MTSAPKETLSVLDSVAIVVGVVVGVGIFKTPSIVASVADSGTMLVLFWLLGGFLSLVGALCYAELASTHPSPGGDYHFLTKAFGPAAGFLYAWSRMTVIQSGSIAMVAFLVGDHAAELFGLGPGANAPFAVGTVGILTTVNVLGITQGKRTQRLLVSVILFGMLAVLSTSIGWAEPAREAAGRGWLPTGAALGTAMIFVMLTYGGWNEAAFISAEVQAKRRNMVKVLLYSIAVVTGTYLLVNVALLRGLGLPAMAESRTVVADLAAAAMGGTGATVVTVLILVAALSTVNATIITGARTNYALGRDHRLFSFLGDWKERGSTPVNALLVQGAVATGLILVGAGSRDGFVMMIEYTAPVFWLFLLLTGLSLFVLRRRFPDAQRGFRVPLYPVTPVVFCLVCVYMLYAALAYTGTGSFIGVIVLLSGVPVLLVQRRCGVAKGEHREESERGSVP